MNIKVNKTKSQNAVGHFNRGPFEYLNADFPTLLYTSSCEIPTLLYTWSLKKEPFRAEPPRIGHYREYPPGVF